MGKLDCLRHSVCTLVTTSEALQDPMEDHLAEIYAQQGVVFEAVGALLDASGAKRASVHKFNEKEDSDSEHEAPAEHVSNGELLKRIKEARAGNRKVVLASMGTVITGDSPDVGWDGRLTGPDGERAGLTGRELCQSAWAAVFDTFGEKRADEGALIIVSLGPQDNALGEIEAPPNAICLPSIPQVDVLKAGVDLFLTHGGQNSFTESMTAGVPIMVCPGFGDQPVNASKAVDLGVGLQAPRPRPALGDEDAACAQYRRDVSEALKRIISEPQFSEAAKKFADGLANLGGVPSAAKRLIEAAASRQHNAEVGRLGGA